MASGFTITQTETPKNSKGKTSKASATFISWSPYPQRLNRKTELVNRIGSAETIIQTLYENSAPTTGMATFFAATEAEVVAVLNTLKGMIGYECKLEDKINSITYEKLVIVDLVTQVKKVGGGWLLIANFNQFLKKE